MPSINHVHTYVKYKKRPGYMRCADPYCTHQLDIESCHGKASKCSVCGTEFILSSQDMKRVRPRCLACSDTAQARKVRAAQALFDSVRGIDSEESSKYDFENGIERDIEGNEK
jgi:hypothetical protein